MLPGINSITIYVGVGHGTWGVKTFDNLTNMLPQYLSNIALYIDQSCMTRY